MFARDISIAVGLLRRCPNVSLWPCVLKLLYQLYAARRPGVMHEHAVSEQATLYFKLGAPQVLFVEP